MDICSLHLLTSHGLRSLVPAGVDVQPYPAYTGVYGGSPESRDAAYHQGTVWGWLIGPFICAYLRAYRDPELAQSYLVPLVPQLSSHGVESLSEIFDGDPPFQPRGSVAQAWTVAEVLRAWEEIEKRKGAQKNE